MDIPAIQVVKNNDNHLDNTIHLSEACELYLRLKGVGKDKVFIRTANRNTGYVAKLLGDRAYTHGNHLTFLTVSIFLASLSYAFKFNAYCKTYSYGQSCSENYAV